MKAISLEPGTKNLRLADVPEPQIQKDNEIKAKVLAVGICGTDREEASGGRANAPAGEKELIIGHEMLSQVVEVGKGVTKVKPGDHVVITVRRGCNECVACKAKRSDMCLTGNYTERGIKGRHGFHSEFVVDEEEFAVLVPKSIVDIAVLAEPISVVQKAIEEAGIIQISRLPYLDDPKTWLKGKTVLVAGLGPIGLLGALVLGVRGAKVLGLDIVDENSSRATILKEMGGTYINDKKLDPAQFQKNYPEIDMILDAAGIAKTRFRFSGFSGVQWDFCAHWGSRRSETAQHRRGKTHASARFEKSGDFWQCEREHTSF